MIVLIIEGWCIFTLFPNLADYICLLYKTGQGLFSVVLSYRSMFWAFMEGELIK